MKKRNILTAILAAALAAVAAAALILNSGEVTTEHDRTLMWVQITVSLIGGFCICMRPINRYRLIGYVMMYVSAVIIASTAVFYLYESSVRERISAEDVKSITLYGEKQEEADIGDIVDEFNRISCIRRKPEEWDGPTVAICLEIELYSGKHISVSKYDRVIEVRVRENEGGAETVYLGEVPDESGRLSAGTF